MTQEASSTLFQVGAYTALIHGLYNGEYTCAQLAQHGDFGLGGLDNLSGELAAFDGNFYKIQEDGQLRLVDPNDVIPFANVTFFKPTAHISVTDISNYAELTQAIASQVANKNVPHAIRFDALCDSAHFSVVRGQKKPYPPISEVLKSRIDTTLSNVTGTIVGFWIPAYFAPLAKTGLHLRFINAERTTGGQLHDVVLKQATLQVQPLHKFEIRLPLMDDFANIDL